MFHFVSLGHLIQKHYCCSLYLLALFIAHQRPVSIGQGLQ